MDSLGGNRKQYMFIYESMMNSLHKEKRQITPGQITLFDLAPEEEKASFAFRLPDVEDYDRETRLQFEKEVMGIYASGHPLDEYSGIIEKRATAKSVDFVLDGSTGKTLVTDGARYTVGGIVSDKKIKYTKNNQIMAFLTLEDLTGTVEVIVFPRTFEECRGKFEEEAKVLVSGRASAEDEKDSKLIAEKIVPFDELPRKLWLKFDTKESYEEKYPVLEPFLSAHPGRDSVIIYLSGTRAKKELKRGVACNTILLSQLEGVLNKDDIRVV